MKQSSVLFKKRMGFVRAIFLCAVPVLVLVAPRWKELSPEHEIMETLGHVLVMLGVLTRIYTSLFSGGRKNKVLLMDGPYSIVRNPLYVGSFLAVLGIGMQTASLTIALLAALVFLAIHHFTILREEKFLSGLYGNEYQSYLEAVPRWIPQFRLWHQPQEIIVQPRMVLLTIRDASMFILALILVELLCELRTANGLPTWLNLI